MDATGQFVVAGPIRTFFGLPVDELGWASALAHVEGLADVRSGQPAPLTIGFETDGARMRQIFDRRFRAVLDGRVLLPAGGRCGRLLDRLAGSRTSMQFSPDRFALSLLTYLERKRRIGLLAGNAEAADAFQNRLARHAPWHDFLIVDPSVEMADRFDLVIADLQSPQDERRAGETLALVTTGLVLMTGGSLSRLDA